MRDVTVVPFAATLGLMGWPYPGSGGTLWKQLILTEGWAPTLALDGHLDALERAWADLYAQVRAGVLEQVRHDFPILSRWADSLDWLQGCGRGDVVACLSLHSGAVLSHHCLGWRTEYRDTSGALWNWTWTLVAPHPLRPGELLETVADASGAVLDRRGAASSKVLVRPELGGDERDGILARWEGAVGEALRDVPRVQVVNVEHEEVDWKAYEASIAKVLEEAGKP